MNTSAKSITPIDLQTKVHGKYLLLNRIARSRTAPDPLVGDETIEDIEDTCTTTTNLLLGRIVTVATAFQAASVMPDVMTGHIVTITRETRPPV